MRPRPPAYLDGSLSDIATLTCEDTPPIGWTGGRDPNLRPLASRNTITKVSSRHAITTSEALDPREFRGLIQSAKGAISRFFRQP